MKRFLLPFMSFLSLAFNLIAGDIYQKGTIKLIPDDAFAQGIDWSKLFTANLPALPYPKMTIREYLALAPDNTIYVVEHNNYDAGTVFKFAADGTLLSTKADTSGKANNSVWAKHLELPAVNDRNELWISEYTRLNRCDRQGNVLAVTKIDHPITNLLFLRGEALLLSGYIITDRGDTKHTVSLLNTQTAKETVFTSFNTKDFSIVLKLEDGRGGLLGMGLSHSNAGKLLIAGTPEGNLVVGYSESPEIQLYSPEGRKIGSFTLPFQRPTLNPEQKAQGMQRIRQSLDSLAADKKVSSDEIERAREKLEEYPTALPYYSNLLIDDQGNILVFPTNPDNSANVEFMAFSQSGKVLGTCRITLPQGVSLRLDGRKQMEFRNGWLYALIHKNVSGKEQVRLARFKME
jgi:hypothetical protein